MIDLYSSYSEEMGKILYDKVIEYKPKLICDIGVLNGFSTYYLTKASIEIGASVVAIDLFEEYDFNSSNLDQFKSNMKRLNVIHNIGIINENYLKRLDWINSNADFIHFDVSNDGKTLVSFLSHITSKIPILFEGGSENRDNQDWMVKYNKPKIINSLKENNICFKVLGENETKREGRIINSCLSEICYE